MSGRARRGVIVGAAFFASAFALGGSIPADVGEVSFQWGVKIPLRDGVQLSSTVYTPKNQQVATPCIFTLTPYVADTYHDRGVYFASHGFPFLSVDVRGRGNSEGQFRPFLQEAQDGYDVVEWLSHQSYCNGKVAMWGGSYAGYDQWVVANVRPPHLATIVPAAAPFIGLDFPMRKNIFSPGVMQWILYTSGHTSQQSLYTDTAFWSTLYGDWYQSGAPFREIDAAMGRPSPILQEWLSHPALDAYWDAYNPSSADYGGLEIPILTITGSNDDDQLGALEHYKNYMKGASAAARARHFLVIGPWDHAGTRTPRRNVEGLEFGPESLLDLPKLHLQWYAWTMQGGAKPDFLKAPVAYYVMGAERWRYAQSLEGVTDKQATYFLDSVGSARDLFASGSLGNSLGSGPADHFQIDPNGGAAVARELLMSPGNSGLVNLREPILLQGHELVYHSAPLATDTEVSGFFKLSVWLGIDQPDADFAASIFDVAVDGQSILLCTDVIRARYRQGLRSPQLIRTSKPLRYDFDRFTFVARQIPKGHRVRLVIAPVILSETNYNGGGIVAEESAHDARVVNVRLLHDRAHPSALYVPFGRADLATEPVAPPASFATE